MVDRARSASAGAGRGSRGARSRLLDGRARRRRAIPVLFGARGAAAGVRSEARAGSRGRMSRGSYDFDWTSARAITDKVFCELYAQLPYDSQFVAVLDCCHSGGMTRDGMPRIRGITAPDDIRHRAMKWDAERKACGSRAAFPRCIRTTSDARRARRLFRRSGRDASVWRRRVAAHARAASNTSRRARRWGIRGRNCRCCWRRVRRTGCPTSAQERRDVVRRVHILPRAGAARAERVAALAHLRRAGRAASP